MSLDIHIEDPSTSNKARVTGRGQVVVSSISFSESFSTTVNVINTAFNLVLPKENQKFVITDIVLTGDKNVSTVEDASIVVYEAPDLASITPDNVLLDVDVARSSSLVLTGLNLITETAAKFINIKSTEINVKATMMGYYVEE
jgi:hypothetical protein